GRKAAELAVGLANGASRSAGARVRVRLSSADSETQGLAGLIAARRQIDDGASCLNGDWATASTLALANQVAAKQGVPMISPASTNFSIARLDDRGYVFRSAPSDALQVIALANLAERSLGGAKGRTISVAARHDGYGTEISRRFAAEWRGRGGRISGPLLYDPTQASFDREAGRIVAGSPSAFAIFDFPETYAKLAPALLATGRFDAARLLTADTLIVDSASQWGIPDAALDGARATQPGAAASGAAGGAFADAFASAPGAPARPDAFAAQSFDATVLCYLAAVAAGSSSPVAIRDEIAAVSGPPGRRVSFTQLGEAIRILRAGRQIDYEGASGPLDLDPHGDPTAATYDVLAYSGGAPRRSGAVEAEARRGGG
ncbi:MAG: branched-chain amino acid transport system substrate-binding protein, partial [Solirubrobacterales bacterium]|nr:branched-chain amino acid transport system substrate-binding protein [Solirubrobacterales bacterium]